MQKSMCYKSRLSILILIILSSCGPTVTISPELSSGKTKIMLALAPIQKSAEIREERAEIFRNTLEAKLKDKGFFLLDRSIVNEVCLDAKCANKSKLFEQYKIGFLLTVHLKDPSETNWGIVSYNSLEGEAKLEDAKGENLYQASASASKSGGLILQSGQILKAIRDIYINTADSIFANLSSKLANNLLESLPEQESAELNEYTSIIENVKKSKINSDFYKVCIQGTPNSIASIIYKKEKTTLREVSMGTYCGSVYGSGETLNLELRTPYGIQAVSNIGI